MAEQQVYNLNDRTEYPKICLSLTGSTIKELLQQIAVAIEGEADLVEWRGDTYHWFYSVERVMEVLPIIKEKLKQIPLIFNFKCSKNGGENSISVAEYRELYLQVAASSYVEFIDMDLDFINHLGHNFVKELKRQNLKIILSDYSLKETPAPSLLLFRLNLMEHLGADIGKIVAMPNDRQDVFSLMELNIQAEAFVTIPIVTISLGKIGRLSRISCGLSGSFITYASVDKIEQDGRLPITALKQTIQLLTNDD